MHMNPPHLLRHGLAIALASAAAFAPFAGAAPTTPPSFARDQEGAAIDGQSVVQAPSPKRQIVAILPDRTTGRDWGLRYLRDAVEDLNREVPDAVFCVGDLVQGYSRDRTHVLRERDDYLGIVRRLSMPFYPTPGNHDVVSGARDAKDRRFADEYRKLFGPLYYSVELELASFVILNTEDGEGRIEPGFSDAQLGWLDGELARLANRGRPIILLFHRPLWDHRPTRWDERVQPMLVKHGVDYVIAGHYHAMQMLPPKDGIPFLLLGTCGGAIDQHPLAGQLQHTSFVVIEESGEIRPYHQIAGSTLPADWMLKSDQDLAYRLKSANNAAEWRGAVPDPVGRPSEGGAELTLRNPLDRELRWTIRRAAAPEPWRVSDMRDGTEIELSWTSRTPIDTFNAHTTDIDSPFELALPGEEIVLAPGATATVRIDARCDALATPPSPPPIEAVARFKDSRGRTVPVLFRLRLPIARSLLLGASADAAVAYPIAVWKPSEYDTPEANATLRVARGAAGSDTTLTLLVEAPDRTLSAEVRPGSGRPSADDPLGDAVRFQLGSGPERRDYLVTLQGSESGPTPLIRRVAAKGALEAAPEAAVTLWRSEGRWQMRIDLARGALPEGATLDGLAINLGVADNDETYHTQWRWLAPREIPALLRTGPAPAP
jgi:hypothetical protein